MRASIVRREFFVFLLLFLSGCSLLSPAKEDPKLPKQLPRIDTENGFADLVLPITRFRCTEQFACLIEARGLYQGRDIGLRVRLSADLSEPDPTGDIPEASFRKDGVEFQSLGEPTRDMALILQEAYGVKFKSNSIRKSLSMTSTTLEGNPKQIEQQELKFKLFFDENEEEGLYFEIYLNIDKKNGTLTLAEKDEEYRQNILRAFLTKPKPQEGKTDPLQ